MPLPTRAFENLPAQILNASARLDLALNTPNLSVSAALLLTLASDMDRLSAKVRAAADAADLQSRRSHLRGTLPAVTG